jgi:hypothetical protein
MERDLALAYLRRNFPLITQMLETERPSSITVRIELDREISLLSYTRMLWTALRGKAAYLPG